jgi:hypothetical protein
MRRSTNKVGFVPRNAKWFLADLVVAISVEGDQRIVVHTNTVLVEARSAVEAHKRALELGRRERQTYRNAAGRRVTCRFLGLSGLNVVHDELEHGAELMFRQRTVRSLAAAKALTRPRKSYAVFQPVSRCEGPDFAPGDIIRELEHTVDAKPTSSRPRQGVARGRREALPT